MHPQAPAAVQHCFCMPLHVFLQAAGLHPGDDAGPQRPPLHVVPLAVQSSHATAIVPHAVSVSRC